jgi:hypothetical protein
MQGVPRSENHHGVLSWRPMSFTSGGLGARLLSPVNNPAKSDHRRYSPETLTGTVILRRPSAMLRVNSAMKNPRSVMSEGKNLIRRSSFTSFQEDTIRQIGCDTVSLRESLPKTDSRLIVIDNSHVTK